MASHRAILVLDEGTTSTRAILYAADGTVLGSAQKELTQYYPNPGWVEHDAAEIWAKTFACAQEMVAKAGGAENIAAIGITNQRETVVAWDKTTGEPICPAIVWQDRRTEARCGELRALGHEPMVQAKTGLVLDPYFSATKMRWILDHVPAARALGDRLAFGTVESWLVFKLTGGLHISDATNASRTMLLALDGADWDAQLLALHGVDRANLPTITDTHGALAVTNAPLFGGAIAICGLAGDQQAATIGQACLNPGEVKATLGTGAFVLANTGTALPRSNHRLLGTVLTQSDGIRTYALEGSLFVAGSLIQWLRDGLGMIAHSAETETLARSVPDAGGVIIVPALSGLGAPHWRADVRGSIHGLTHGATRAHIIRAALEAMAHQIADLRDAYAGDANEANGCDWQTLRIDGGMSSNDFVAQDMADVLALPVQRPDNVETTALGAAMLAAVGCGLYPDLIAASAMRGGAKMFAPNMADTVRQTRLSAWHKAVGQALA
jgi:glycerol kinase